MTAGSFTILIISTRLSSNHQCLEHNQKRGITMALGKFFFVRFFIKRASRQPSQKNCSVVIFPVHLCWASNDQDSFLLPVWSPSRVDNPDPHVFALQIETVGEPSSGDRLRHFSESAVGAGEFLVYLWLCQLWCCWVLSVSVLFLVLTSTHWKRLYLTDLRMDDFNCCNDNFDTTQKKLKSWI